nr:hypothetical protein [Tanacetum cinerariifolium]
MDGEAMINSIQNGDQPLPVIALVSLSKTTQNVPPTLKDLKFWTAEEKKTQKIDHLWDALERQMRGSEDAEQDREAAILYEYETFKATEGEYELKKITALLAKAFNRRKFYSKPTNNNLRTSSTSQSANKKQEFVKSDDKKVEKKDDEKKRDMSKVNSGSDQEINANMVFMVQIEKVLSNSDESSSSAEETIVEVLSDSDESSSSAEETIVETDKSEVDHNDSEEKEYLVDKV